MTTLRTFLAASALAGMATFAGPGTVSTPALAGDDYGTPADSKYMPQAPGRFMVRLNATGLIFDEKFRSPTLSGEDAKVNDLVIPTATITYFLSPELSAELFCCFTRHSVDGAGSIKNLGEVAETWVFPPILTLQRHFHLGRYKPYVGAGIAYMTFFDEEVKPGNALGARAVSVDDAWGFALQAGLDIELRQGWYATIDVKKVWIDTDVTWRLNNGGTLRGDLDLNPLLISIGLGTRFDLF